jgi:cobalt/nickel transport system permease protein
MHPPQIETRPGGVLGGVSPRLKLLAALLIVTATVLLPRRPDAAYFIPALLLVVLWLLSRMPLLYALRRWLVVQVFVVGILLLSLLNPATAPIVASAFIKSNLCLFTMLLLTWTTPFHEILQELRRLRLPPVMLTTLALMYRYLPVLSEESRRMQRARASRTYSRGRRLAWANLTSIIGQLFVRTADRAERIYLAMCARGWK